MLRHRVQCICPFKFSDIVVIMIINVKMTINVGIITFKSMINSMFT